MTTLFAARYPTNFFPLHFFPRRVGQHGVFARRFGLEHQHSLLFFLPLFSSIVFRLCCPLIIIIQFYFPLHFSSTSSSSSLFSRFSRFYFLYVPGPFFVYRWNLGHYGGALDEERLSRKHRGGTFEFEGQAILA